MHVVSLGPWIFPVGIIAIALGWFVASAIAAFLRRRGHADAAPFLWWLLLLALVVARVVFVARWWSAYAESPLSILDIRDRGFNPYAGLIALVMAMLVVMRRRPRVQRVLPATVVAGLAAGMLTVLVASQLQTSSHPPLAGAELRQLDGRSTTLATLSGKPMVVNLWATWCPPCRAEMPMLISASHQISGVRFVFVDQGESAKTVRAFLSHQQMDPRHVLLDPDKVLSRDYRALGYPTTLFMDAKGRLRDTQVGPLSRATLEQHLLRITSPATRSLVSP